MLLCVSIWFTLASAPVVTGVTQSRVFSCSNEYNNPNQFRCQNGTNCISTSHLCDGIKDCEDASDEASCHFHNEGNHIQADDAEIRKVAFGRSLHQDIPSSYLKSKYNSIADCSDTSDTHISTSRSRRRRQLRVPLSGSSKPGACVLPPHPRNGRYVVSNSPDARPGDSFETFVLTVSCRRGYGFADTEVGVDGTAPQQVYCINGQWYQLMPKCVRYCKLEPDPSVRYQCGVYACKTYVPPGTSASPVCNSPIYYSPESLPYMKCVAGFWNYVAKCKPECGRVTPEGKHLVLNGEVAKRGELPWHVGIYVKTYSPYMQICGGSLVSINVVISAAHCFWNDVKKRLPASDYAVAGGKLYRPWTNELDYDVQKSDVKEIKMPTLYGAASNFQEDIAALILVTSFVYKTYVRPVCLNFDVNFDRRQLQHGKIGKVAGWGIVTANGQASPVLRVINIPFIDLETCINTVPPSFREYITGDKFCAGYTNGTAPCKGDSGGGLAFAAYTELNVERYYLRGIVSAAPSNDDLCNANSYTTFTKILKHEDFIQEAIVSADSTCPPNLFKCDDGACVYQGADCNGMKDCPDGSDESDDLCTVHLGVVGESAVENFRPPPTQTGTTQSTPRCVLPPYPENGIYEEAKNPEVKPGQALLSYVINVRCNEDYDLLDPNGNILGSNRWQVICTAGERSQVMPKCSQCGRVNESEPLMIGGRPAKRGELPWHVSIYEKSPASNKLTCGGSIITKSAVLSAAHCFGEKSPPQPSKYAVATGKLLTSWNADEDTDAQKSDVKEIKIPSSFNRKDNTLVGDIAVLVLSTPFTFTSTVKPVCLNFEPNFNIRQLQPGKVGRVAAWSFDGGNSNSESPRLKSLMAIDMSHIDLDTCNNSLPVGLGKYVTADKICAGYTKDRRVFRSLAGSGLVFPNTFVGVQRFYLLGLTSYVVPCFDQCVDSQDSYFMFSKIFDQMDFIKEYL